MSKRRSETPTKYDPSAPRLTRREQLRQQRRRRSLMWNVIVLGVLGLFLLAVAWYALAVQRPGPLPGEVEMPDEGNAKVAAGTTIQYQNSPPTSGKHYEQPAPWGVSEAPVPEGTFVANLAEGGVVILYSCPTGCPDTVAALREVYAAAGRPADVRLLITPYAGQLEQPVVALAWRHKLPLATVDKDILLRFYRRYLNQGPA